MKNENLVIAVLFGIILSLCISIIVKVAYAEESVEFEVIGEGPCEIRIDKSKLSKRFEATALAYVAQCEKAYTS